MVKAFSSKRFWKIFDLFSRELTVMSANRLNELRRDIDAPSPALRKERRILNERATMLKIAVEAYDQEDVCRSLNRINSALRSKRMSISRKRKTDEADGSSCGESEDEDEDEDDIQLGDMRWKTGRYRHWNGAVWM
jgi:hypothetical protein